MAAAAPAGADFVLNILHINDLHSRLQPVNEYGGPCPEADQAAGRCLGGVARVKALIDARRRDLSAAGEAVIVLDAGDQFQGSLFFNTYQGDAAAEFMNAVGFDAMAVGNHEFDEGPETLARFAARIDFPLLAANLDTTGSPSLDGRIAPWTVIETAGERIGIVGAVAEDTPETSSPGPGLVFKPVIGAVSDAVQRLQADGVDKIVILTHVGIAADREIAHSVSGVDAVVGGHSHTLLSNRADADAAGPYPWIENGPSGHAVPVVQAGSYSRHVGELRLRFDDAGQVLEATGTTHPLDASVTPDPIVAARVRTLAEPFAAMMARTVGRVAADLDATACRTRECEFGNLVADAMLARVRDQGVSIALVNGGSMRTSLDAGDITYAELLTALPFANTLSTFVIDGEELRQALENGVSRVEDGAGRFPQVAGLRFAWSGESPPGQRVRSVEIATDAGWQPLEPDHDYRAVTNDFLRRGGDGYSMLRDGARQVYDYGPTVDEVLVDYLAARPGYVPSVGGRITRVD